MRNLVILRGPQGVGKSRFVEMSGLVGQHLSFDKIREVVSGDTVHSDGTMTVPQHHNRLVHRLAIESIERRMTDGETIAFEATLPQTSDVRELTDLALSHRYAVTIVDFYGIPIEVSKAANALRPERVRVPDASIERVYGIATQAPLPEGDHIRPVVRVTDPVDIDGPVWTVRDFLARDVRPVDLSAYRKIVHVGDLQGTLHPLLHPDSPLADGLEDDVFHVFVGDLFDRGVENAAVARWWLDNACGRPNVALIAGNHEDHVELEAAGLKAVSREWQDITWPELRAGGIVRADLERIASHAVPLLRYSWNGVQVYVTHPGFSRMPAEPELVPETMLRRGNGHYGLDIDAIWSSVQDAAVADGGEGVFQVHGHRNRRMSPVHAAPWSLNLEGQVEFGGHMRFAVLDERGWTTAEVRSDRFRSMVEAHAIDTRLERSKHGAEPPMTPWALRGDVSLDPISPKTVEAFGNHAMILETRSETMPHVSSVNFTKAAYYGKAWDDYTTVARGLFMDNLDHTVLARGFQKFWNHGERPETSDEGLQATVRYPVRGYDKINGFFCTTGYSERTGELVIASKSRIEGTFPSMARAVLLDKLGEAGLERLLRFNRDQVASLVFEVVDIDGDPHVIDYPENRLVLIGCVRRSEAFEQVEDHALLAGVARWIGCDVTEQTHRALRNWTELSHAMDVVENKPSWRSKDPTEGVVFIDAAGMMWKSKGWFYASWKRMRGAVERIALARRKSTGFDRARYADMAGFQDFLDWAETLPDAALSVGIVRLRHLWLNDRAAAETMGPAHAGRAPDMSGYARALDGMAAKVASGHAKPESVRRMVEAALASDDKRAVLEAHPAVAALREAARL